MVNFYRIIRSDFLKAIRINGLELHINLYKYRVFVALLLILVFTAIPKSFAQDTLRIMSYNLNDYPKSDTATINPKLRTILSAIKPDVLVGIELTSSTWANNFKTRVF